MNPKNLILTGGLLIALITIGTLSGALSHSNEATASRGEPWPAFTLKYDLIWHPGGLDQPAASETWKVDYTDTNHWRVELIAATASTSPVGFWTSFDGEFYRTYNLPQAHLEEIKAEHWTVPNDWLVPGLVNALPDKGYQLVSEPVDGDSITYAKTTAFECSGGPPACPSIDKTDHTLTSELAFSKEFGIPIEVVDRVDDQLSRHVVVTELTVRR